MEILKGLVRDPGYPDLECNYAKIDDNTIYYFIKDGQLDNGNYIVSTKLKEAIEHAPHTSLGIIDKDGKVLVPFENKKIQRIKDNLLLVERNVPISEGVVAALNEKNDPNKLAVLQQNADTIKKQITAIMGMGGDFIFDNLFSEATIYTMDGLNVSGNYYSFIGEFNSDYYFASNVVGEQIIKFNPVMLEQVKVNEFEPKQNEESYTQNQMDNGQFEQNNIEEQGYNQNNIENTEVDNNLPTSDGETPLGGDNVSTEAPDQNLDLQLNLNSLADTSIDNENNDVNLPEEEHVVENNSDVDLPGEEQAVEENSDVDLPEEEQAVENNSDVDLPEEEHVVEENGDADLPEEEQVVEENGDADLPEEEQAVENNSDVDLPEEEQAVEENSDVDLPEEEQVVEENNDIYTDEEIENQSMSSYNNDSSNETTEADIINPVIADATTVIRRLLKENKEQRKVIDKQTGELEAIKTNYSILSEENEVRKQEVEELREELNNYRAQATQVSRDNNKMRRTLMRQAEVVKNLENQNSSLRQKVAGLHALGNAVAEANILIDPVSDGQYGDNSSNVKAA